MDNPKKKKEVISSPENTAHFGSELKNFLSATAINMNEVFFDKTMLEDVYAFFHKSRSNHVYFKDEQGKLHSFGGYYPHPTEDKTAVLVLFFITEMGEKYKPQLLDWLYKRMYPHGYRKIYSELFDRNGRDFRYIEQPYEENIISFKTPKT